MFVYQNIKLKTGSGIERKKKTFLNLKIKAIISYKKKREY